MNNYKRASKLVKKLKKQKHPNKVHVNITISEIAELLITNWISYLFIAYGVFAIVGGFCKQYQGMKESEPKGQ